MLPIPKFECPKFLEEVSTPAGKEIGLTLGNLFYIVFSKFNLYAEKKRIQYEADLKAFESAINSEIDKIPEEKLIEPSISIIMPTLDASKFYIEHEEMRSMFSKLIAASINIDTAPIAHHSFVEIIKQLNPLDAKLLSAIFNGAVNSMIRYKLVQKYVPNKPGFTIIEHILKSDSITEDAALIPVAIDNLVRLGLIKFSYNFRNIDDKPYSDIESLHDEEIINYINERYLSLPKYETYEIEKNYGSLDLTNFGLNFTDVCVG